MVVGMIGALLAGLVFPLLFYLFGNLTNAMTSYQFAYFNDITGTPCDECTETGESGCPEADKQLNDDMTEILWQFCTLGGVMWLGQYIFSVALNTSALRQTIRIRKEFLKGTLRQDVGWYDTTTTSDFATKMTEDLNKVQDGMGEKVGMMLRFIQMVPHYACCCCH